MLAVRHRPTAEATVEHADLWCGEHLVVPSDDLCGWCGRGWCADCLVRPFGEARPPYCLRCAVEAAGVRHRTVRRRVTSRHDRRRLERRRSHLAVLERPTAGPHVIELRDFSDVLGA